MKYLKLFEEFVISKPKPKEIEISDKTIDDVLKDDFLKDSDLDEDEVIKTDNNVYQIKKWKVY